MSLASHILQMWLLIPFCARVFPPRPSTTQQETSAPLLFTNRQVTRNHCHSSVSGTPQINAFSVLLGPSYRSLLLDVSNAQHPLSSQWLLPVPSVIPYSSRLQQLLTIFFLHVPIRFPAAKICLLMWLRVTDKNVVELCPHISFRKLWLRSRSITVLSCHTNITFLLETSRRHYSPAFSNLHSPSGTLTLWSIGQKRYCEARSASQFR